MQKSAEHSNDCSVIHASLRQCLKENPVKQLFGVCSKLEVDLATCIRLERIRKRDENFKNSQQRQARASKKSAEVKLLKEES